MSHRISQLAAAGSAGRGRAGAAGERVLLGVARHPAAAACRAGAAPPGCRAAGRDGRRRGVPGRRPRQPAPTSPQAPARLAARRPRWCRMPRRRTACPTTHWWPHRRRRSRGQPAARRARGACGRAAPRARPHAAALSRGARAGSPYYFLDEPNGLPPVGRRAGDFGLPTDDRVTAQSFGLPGARTCARCSATGTAAPPTPAVATGGPAAHGTPGSTSSTPAAHAPTARTRCPPARRTRPSTCTPSGATSRSCRSA